MLKLTLSEAIQAVKPAIVQILLLGTNLEPAFQAKIQAPFFKHILGTGFFVSDDGHVITAKHVIDDGLSMLKNIPAKNKHILVGLALPNSDNFLGNFSCVDFELVDADAEHDLILLKLAKNPFKGEVHSGINIGGVEQPLLYGVPVFNTSRPSDGLSIAISGYPLAEIVLITNSGGLATCWGNAHYLADIEVNPGNSGGPVYKIETSTIIGLCSGNKQAPICDQNGNVANIGGKNYYYSSGLTVLFQVNTL